MSNHLVAAILVGIVAVLCGLVAFGSRLAVVRTGNRRIHFVTWAFVLLACKNLLKAIDMAAGREGEAFEEILFSAVDLIAVGLIAWPLLWRRP